MLAGSPPSFAECRDHLENGRNGLINRIQPAKGGENKRIQIQILIIIWVLHKLESLTYSDFSACFTM